MPHGLLALFPHPALIHHPSAHGGSQGMSASDVAEFLLSSPSTSSPPRPGARVHRSVTLRLIRPSAPSGEFVCRWGVDGRAVASDSEDDGGSVAELETQGARDVREAEVEVLPRGGGGRRGGARGDHGGVAGEDGPEGEGGTHVPGAARGGKQSGVAERRSAGVRRGDGRKREDGVGGGRTRKELLRVAEESLAAASERSERSGV